MQNISFIIPSKNNLRYLKLAYKSIRDFCGYEHEICMCSDISNDGTVEWLKEINNNDKNTKIFSNENDERLGHTVLYDYLISKSSNEIFIIFHADMVASPNMLNCLGWCGKNKVVSLTRIEPPLHPSGPEKIIKDFGVYPENFKYDDFRDFCLQQQELDENKYHFTDGIFAPWIMHKEDFQKINGHDLLFAPCGLEDSDIFNRMKLAGIELIQSRDCFVYHFTARGERFTEEIGKDSKEYSSNMANKQIDWIRKWKQPVMHTSLMDPIVKPVYEFSIFIENPSLPSLYALEPWFNHVYTNNEFINEKYVFEMQNKTIYNIDDKLIHVDKFSNIEKKEKILFIVKKLNEFHVKSLETILSIVTNFEQYIDQFVSNEEQIFEIGDNIEIHTKPFTENEINITGQNIVAQNHKYEELKEKIKNIKELTND